MMTKHPGVIEEEDGLSLVQWLQKTVLVTDPSSWGGDLELRLLAIGLSRDIVVITVAENDYMPGSFLVKHHQHLK